MNFMKLNSYLDGLAECGIPACDLAVSYRGESVYRHCAGYADIEKKRLVSKNDLYFVFSISKITTCVAAMQLVERGKLRLDDPVSKYILSFAYLTVKQSNGGVAPAQNVMTVEHLFTMTGGLSYDLRAPALKRALQMSGGKTLDMISAMAESPLEFEPGTSFRYSLCHDVLAGVVEAVTGVRFADYVQQNIFDPLGMINTGYHLPEEFRPRLSTMYRHVHGIMRATPIPCSNEPYVYSDAYDSGGAGLYSCTDDQIKLMTVLANGGKTADGYCLLRPETIRMMGENRLIDSVRPYFEPNRLYGYGWGLCGRAHENPRISGSLSSVGEFGWDGAAGSFGLIDPERQIGVFFAMQVLGCTYAYHIVHPTLRNLIYETLNKSI